MRGKPGPVLAQLWLPLVTHWHNLTPRYIVSVTEQELAGVSDLVKKRAKVAEVNQVYQTIYDHFQQPKA